MKQNDLCDSISISSSENRDPDKATYSFTSTVEGEQVSLVKDLSHQPSGLQSMAITTGIKYPDVLDFTVVAMDKPGAAAGVFTRNRSASPAVIIDRKHIENGQAQALVVISKNANVFTPSATADTLALVSGVADALNIAREDVLVSCTGVIGAPLPMDKVRQGISQIKDSMKPTLCDQVAEAIMTTDVAPKVASIKFGDVVIAGMAKGAGMIEPNMATMLSYFFTNLAVPAKELQAILQRVCDSTFNSISVDTDTSTSDSVMVFSTNEVAANAQYLADFEKALGLLSLKLAKDIVYQGEGASKLIEVTVDQAKSNSHAKQIAKQIVNSPLVKTAVFGADPNWGRIVMAMGKPLTDGEPCFDPEKIVIKIAGMTLFDRGQATDADLDALSKVISETKHVDIDVKLGEGDSAWTVWGCDLSYKYVEINAEYTT